MAYTINKIFLVLLICIDLLSNSECSKVKRREITNVYVAECDDSSGNATFSGYDYAVLLSMLVISLGIGVFYGFVKKAHGEEVSNEFLLGHEMPLLPVTLSLTTSFITAIELLGNPAEMYYHGTQFFLIVIPMVLVIPVGIKVFYPIYYKMDLVSCYEYLGIRFGKEVRSLGAVLYVIQMCFYTAVAVLAPAIALSKATGMNTHVAVILIYMVCVFYSSQGGMKAVVIADTFQASVLAFSLILITALGYFYSGGPTEIWQNAEKKGRIEFFNFDVNPTTRHTAFSVIIGGFFYWTSLFCTNQASVQKCMSLKSLKMAKKALIFSIMGLVIVFLINFYTGLMIFNHYSGCDQLTIGRITATDQLMPFYVINTYEKLHTVAGIFVAGIFAASLGTVATALNSMSAVTCEDFLKTGLNIKIPSEHITFYAKWMSLGYGIFSFILVYVVERLGGVLQATLTLNGLVGGVTLGLFVLGIAFKQANTRGTFYGGIVSLIIVVIIAATAELTNEDPELLPLESDNCFCQLNTTVLHAVADSWVHHEEAGFSSWSIFKISYIWYSMVGTMLTIILGLLISVIINCWERQKIEGLTNVRLAGGSVQISNKSSATSKPSYHENVGQGHTNHAIRIEDE